MQMEMVDGAGTLHLGACCEYGNVLINYNYLYTHACSAGQYQLSLESMERTAASIAFQAWQSHARAP